MHAGTRYTFKEFILWTRRNIYKAFILSFIPTFLFQVVGLKWLAIPWAVTGLLGTASAFTVGFRIHKPTIELGKPAKSGERY